MKAILIYCTDVNIHIQWWYRHSCCMIKRADTNPLAPVIKDLIDIMTYMQNQSRPAAASAAASTISTINPETAVRKRNEQVDMVNAFTQFIETVAGVVISEVKTEVDKALDRLDLKQNAALDAFKVGEFVHSLFDKDAEYSLWVFYHTHPRYMETGILAVDDAWVYIQNKIYIKFNTELVECANEIGGLVSEVAMNPNPRVNMLADSLALTKADIEELIKSGWPSEADLRITHKRMAFIQFLQKLRAGDVSDDEFINCEDYILTLYRLSHDSGLIRFHMQKHVAAPQIDVLLGVRKYFKLKWSPEAVTLIRRLQTDRMTFIHDPLFFKCVMDALLSMQNPSSETVPNLIVGPPDLSPTIPTEEDEDEFNSEIPRLENIDSDLDAASLIPLCPESRSSSPVVGNAAAALEGQPTTTDRNRSRGWRGQRDLRWDIVRMNPIREPTSTAATLSVPNTAVTSTATPDHTPLLPIIANNDLSPVPGLDLHPDDFETPVRVQRQQQARQAELDLEEPPGWNAYPNEDADDTVEYHGDAPLIREDHYNLESKETALITAVAAAKKGLREMNNRSGPGLLVDSIDRLTLQNARDLKNEIDRIIGSNPPGPIENQDKK